MMKTKWFAKVIRPGMEIASALARCVYKHFTIFKILPMSEIAVIVLANLLNIYIK